MNKLISPECALIIEGRSGLLKKAHEISVLCDAEVALLIFSPKGKLYEYSTDSSMEKLLQRYYQSSSVERAPVEADPQSQVSWCHECGKLKAKVEALQERQRQLMGEELEALTLKELQQLERQLDTSLRLMRSRKASPSLCAELICSVACLLHNRLLFDSIEELQRKANVSQRELREERRDRSSPVPDQTVGLCSFSDISPVMDKK
ncbi:MADS-box transcription factor [Musa troglodytarum]|uniref:MADS-box transcription factor n=1 Tax=Musa troglodytarum TaxID=320322 RepID=A0A9E7E9I2_9LILI|nr:MADS-box transcription factor [Musa troglodytarum]